MSPNRIFSFSTAVTLKIRSSSPKSNHGFVMSQCISLKFGKNPTIGSQDIVEARKSHANAKKDFFSYCCDLENYVKVTKILSVTYQ